jgi:3-hydroxyacyl-CoA dehydrogenase
MGAQIAAHLANAGVPVALLDVSMDAANAGLERARGLKPDPFFVPDAASLIRTGTLDDLSPLTDCDWIVEAVIENLEVKRDLMRRVDRHRAAGAMVSSNTSGIPLAAIAVDRSDSFRRHWLGTHFFNPPRYLRLVEVIPTTDTDPSIVQRLTDFLDRRLGKGVVLAKDTPAFIANRIGMFGVVRLLEAVASGEYSIEEVDAITGPAIGRPKSATFRTLDIAGVDILAHVARDLARRLPDETDRRQFTLPPFVDVMIARGLLGEKSGQGFYKRVKRGGDSEILTLDIDRLLAVGPGAGPADAYVPRREPHLPSVDATRSIADTGDRIRVLFQGQDKVGALLRATLGPTIKYAARIAPEIAHSPDDIDRAMRLGFGWELGPFETRAAIAGEKSSPKSMSILHDAKTQSRVVKRNAGASLVDLGDGVLCVEFHSKMNVIGGDSLAMLRAGVQEASANFAALVVGNDADHFSAGANLTLLLLEAQEGNWDEVDLMVRQFQGTTMALKTCAVPVIAAPAGLALGGGCEICLHADRVQAAAETYLGLVEVGVGLIPAGGGTKEMLVRAAPGTAGTSATFETIAFGHTSGSAPQARRLGYLRDVDGITMNRDRVMADAKAVALARAADGYQAPAPRTDIPVGGPDVFALLSLGVHLAQRAGRISDHDALIGRKLAWILSGGHVPHRMTVSEAYLLDLEREAFLSLCGERKTLERIGYTLKTGKTLRN